jgi:hypothetical protein
MCFPPLFSIFWLTPPTDNEMGMRCLNVNLQNDSKPCSWFFYDGKGRLDAKWKVNVQPFH